MFIDIAYDSKKINAEWLKGFIAQAREIITNRLYLKPSRAEVGVHAFSDLDIRNYDMVINIDGDGYPVSHWPDALLDIFVPIHIALQPIVAPGLHVNVRFCAGGEVANGSIRGGEIFTRRTAVI